MACSAIGGEERFKNTGQLFGPDAHPEVGQDDLAVLVTVRISIARSPGCAALLAAASERNAFLIRFSMT